MVKKTLAPAKKQPKQGKQGKTEAAKKPSKAKGEAGPSGVPKMTLCTVNSTQMRQRRPGRPPSGKRVPLNREMPGKLRSAYRRSLDPCDNSNDSGLGFDHHMDPHQGMERVTWAEAKRPRMDIKEEEVNDGYSFPETTRPCKDAISMIRTAPSAPVPSLGVTTNHTTPAPRAVPRCLPITGRHAVSAPVSLTTQLSAASRFMDVSLTILKQPEQQHRARYQTEGSRGAVKDREGNGFPVVQLHGYYKPATLQVFIGTDVGKVTPHMFYQACKVSGKNSTPCVEKKVDGTCLIELQLDPTKDMSATCDCVGILKERNVDVEHRFPDQLGNRSKKKSTRCRMVFRTTILLDDGTQETLQVCSQPIVCTQPPGVPEICKKSLTSCPAAGGLELFVLGKNFLKDTKVYFQQYEDGQVRWETCVAPDKEYLQQTHFVCVIPPYRRPDITEPQSVRLCVVSSGKTSESHQFVYTPVNGAMPSVHVEPPQAPTQAHFFKGMWQTSSLSKREQDLDMMPPPESSLVPLSTRRTSISVPTSSDVHSPPLHHLKQEYIDESSNSSIMDPMDVRHERFRHISESSLDVHHGDSNMSMINDNSIDMMNHNSMMGHVMNDNSNLSISEDSMDMVSRRNSLSRPSRSTICETSLDVNSNMSTINDDSSCSNMMPCVTETTGMDLRMKMTPLSTLQFSTTLPTQSAQSVENYLTKIETTEPVYLRNQRPFLPNTAKSEAAAVAENTLTTIASTTLTSALDSTITTPINTERLDAFVNSTVESHMGSPTKTTVTQTTVSPVSEVMLSTQDVMLVPPPLINTNAMPSPSEIANGQQPQNISPDVILNSQISPSLMCHNPQELLPTTITQQLIATTTTLVTEPEKAVLLEAAVDLLQTQKKICELATTQFPEQTNIIKPLAQDCIPLPVKEMTVGVGGDKKTDDRMIPQSFTSLTENELINLINPSCFDQV